MTPRLTRDEVKEFLEINRNMTLIGFVELTRTALNGRVFSCRRGIEEIEFLLQNGLLERKDDPQGGVGLWWATVRGRKYVDFMLGDRYFIPYILIEPQVPINDLHIEICMDFEGHIARAEAAVAAMGHPQADKQVTCREPRRVKNQGLTCPTKTVQKDSPADSYPGRLAARRSLGEMRTRVVSQIGWV
jgi:hypothetical protein